LKKGKMNKITFSLLVYSIAPSGGVNVDTNGVYKL
jgi:hypothetical protein